MLCLEIQLETVNICFHIWFLIRSVGVGGEEGIGSLIHLPQNVFYIDAVDCFSRYGFCLIDISNISIIYQIVNASAMHHTNRKLRAANLKHQLCNFKPISIQKERWQVDMLQAISAIHGIDSGSRFNSSSRLLSFCIVSILVVQFDLIQTWIRSIVVCLVVIIQIF